MASTNFSCRQKPGEQSGGREGGDGGYGGYGGLGPPEEYSANEQQDVTRTVA